LQPDEAFGIREKREIAEAAAAPRADEYRKGQVANKAPATLLDGVELGVSGVS
jgi:hypothetical protein